MGRRRERREQSSEAEWSVRRGREAARREQMEAEAPQWAWLAADLEAAGVDPRDLGRFVNDTRFIRPSVFDELGAMPVLLRVLPRLTQANVVAAVGDHLNHRGARPAAFPELLEQFKKWATLDPLAGHSLATALATTSTWSYVDDLLAIAADRTYGEARIGVVEALWRYKKDSRVESLLRNLLPDPDTCWAAMSALRRTVGNEAALPDLRQLRDTTDHPIIREHAAEQVKRTERALAKSADAHPGGSTALEPRGLKRRSRGL